MLAFYSLLGVSPHRGRSKLLKCPSHLTFYSLLGVSHEYIEDRVIAYVNYIFLLPFGSFQLSWRCRGGLGKLIRLSTPFWEFRAKSLFNASKTCCTSFYSLLGVSFLFFMGNRYDGRVLHTFYSLLGVSSKIMISTISSALEDFLLPFGSFYKYPPTPVDVSEVAGTLSTPFWEFLGLSSLLQRSLHGFYFLLPFGSFSVAEKLLELAFAIASAFYSLLGVSLVVKVNNMTYALFPILSTPFWEFQ